MKFVSAVIFLFSIYLVNGQNLILKGKAESSDLKAKGKIYYTKPGEAFSGKKFISVDENFNYTFKISLAKLSKEEITVLSFSSDSTSNSSDINACAQQINVGNIVNSKWAKKGQDIVLYSDLLLDFACQNGALYGAKEEGKERFVGQYLLNINNAELAANLSDNFFRYKSVNYKSNDAGHMDAEYGSWSYEEATKELTLNVWQEINESLGIKKKVNKEYKFTVSEENGKLNFKSDLYKLTKL